MVFRPWCFAVVDSRCAVVARDRVISPWNAFLRFSLPLLHSVSGFEPTIRTRGMKKFRRIALPNEDWRVAIEYRCDAVALSCQGKKCFLGILVAVALAIEPCDCEPLWRGSHSEKMILCFA